jgi:predicted transcriptional regulator of viral defense system
MTYRRDKERVGRFAARQQGRVTLGQLRHLRVSASTAQGWEAQGYLERTLPGVFAVGHTAPAREADLWAAVLYAGPGATLSHRTAARWRGLIDYAPCNIEVSTPRKVRSLKGIKVHGRRTDLEREFHKGIPVTSIPVMMVDVAATSRPRVVHRALGQLDFQKLLDVDALLGACRRGREGAAALRRAIDAYDPGGGGATVATTWCCAVMD